MRIRDDLFNAGLYLVGDSAYSIRGFLLTPYDNARPNSKEDAFNFYLSNQRIYVECAFGEIDRRFGIFWKRLEGNLEHHQYTIDACLRLHNLIVNYREKEGLNTEENDLEENLLLDLACDDYMELHPLETVGAFADDVNEHLMPGRPSKTEADERERGRTKRDRLKDSLWREGLARPGNVTVDIVRDRHNRVVNTRHQDDP